MNTLLRLSVIAWLGFGFGSVRALADDCCTLRGQVVSSADGAPVRGALVQVTGEAPQSVMTSADGTFAIPNLKPGDFTIHARKPGYFTPDQIDSSIAPIQVHLDANAAPIILRLTPEGVVYGRIVDETGEPVEGSQVWLEGTKSSGSPGPLARRGSQDTLSNEIGEYRIAGIRPGSYFLIVSSRPEQNSEFVTQVESVRQNRKDYPVTYYPGTISRSQAVPIHVRAGAVQQLEVRITKQPLYQVAGRVDARGTPEGTLVVLVSLASRRPFGVIHGTTDGSFVFPEVSPGEYLLWATGDSNDDQNVENIRLGSRYLNVTGNVSGLTISTAKVANAEVYFRWELSHGTHSETPAAGESLPVFFSRMDSPVDMLQMLRLRPPEDEHGVSHAFFEPGTYRLKVRRDTKMYVARATSGGTDLLRENLMVTLGSVPEPIQIVLRDDGAAINGQVAGTSSANLGRVFAVPADQPAQTISTPVAADGSFHFAYMAPGRYSLVALENSDAVDLDDMQVVSRVERMGEAKELQADSTSTLQLEWKRWNE
jgi:Carboxypeptidase regulatory-like domain